MSEALTGLNFSALESSVRVPAELDVKVRACSPPDASTLARLHCENVSDRLGIPLLEVYYRACLTTSRHFCLCAEADGQVVGYIGVLSGRIRLMKLVLRREWAGVLACLFNRPLLLVELVRHGWSWLRLRWPSTASICLPQWEYRPLVVTRKYRGRRIA